MGQKVGAYLGGIRTVEDLRQRSHVDDETGCWHWSLAMNGNSPKVWFCLNGKRSCMRGRRAALSILNGENLPRELVAFAIKACHSDDCVNPGHSRVGDRKAAGKALAKSGRVKGLSAKIRAARATGSKRCKFSPEIVAEIRSSIEPTAQIAKRLGVAQNTVHQCRVGNSYKPSGNSVFSWRPA